MQARTLAVPPDTRPEDTEQAETCLGSSVDLNIGSGHRVECRVGGISSVDPPDVVERRPELVDATVG